MWGEVRAIKSNQKGFQQKQEKETTPVTASRRKSYDPTERSICCGACRESLTAALWNPKARVLLPEKNQMVRMPRRHISNPPMATLRSILCAPNNTLPDNVGDLPPNARPAGTSQQDREQLVLPTLDGSICRGVSFATTTTRHKRRRHASQLQIDNPESQQWSNHMIKLFPDKCFSFSL